ncbi:hypothetical protein MLD38_024478 [Melastoma candidum]|uniref:Uncharacterized protein n=1 Tax=Melastoma candidum TaxID=119954 RepID=A0ACB9NTZ0_9MYRT|nr:hypothetical protein MLD38_024478 [Melastoma candidum]
MLALAYQVEKFEGVKCDFPLWQMRMRDFLMIHGLGQAVVDFLSGFSDEEKSMIDARALALIRASLSNNVLRHVMRETSAIVVSRMLEEIYSKATLTGHLENIEVKIEEEDKAMILCCSLPLSLEHFVDTLLYGKTTITLSEVVNAMLSKDERMKAMVVEESGQGLVARGRNMDRTSSNKKWRSKSRGKSKGSIVCFGCKQTGHMKKE